MVATCSLTALSTDCIRQQCMNESGNATNRQGGGWPGANYNITFTEKWQDLYSWAYIEFYSVANEMAVSRFLCDTPDCAHPELPKEQLTKAECMINMSYVEAQVHCEGRSCAATSVRPSSDPKIHAAPGGNRSSLLNSTVFTGLNSGRNLLSSNAINSFWQSLAVATNPSIACGTNTCPTSAIENYLADPLSVGRTPGDGNPLLWQVEERAFSRRMTQLINTYWIYSIAPYAIYESINPNTSTLLYDNYNIDRDLATHYEPFTAIKCDHFWLAILLISSAVLFTAAVISVILSLCRRGPDILDNFSSILRYNKDLPLPSHSSMDNSSDINRLLGNTRVRLGDVSPEEEVGCVGFALEDEVVRSTKLKSGRLYA